MKFLKKFALEIFLFCITGALVSAATTTFGQNKIYYAAGRTTDTAFTPGAWLLNSVMRATYYATPDTNKVVGFDANGLMVLRTKPTGGAGSADSITFYTVFRADTSRTNIYNQLVGRLLYTDTSTTIATKKNLADTSALLRTLIPATLDTTSLSNRINLKVTGVASSVTDNIMSFGDVSGKQAKDALVPRNRLVNSLNIGLIEGGALSVNADPTKFNISDGNGVIISQWSNPNTPVIYNVSWTGLTGLTATFLNTSTVTHVLIDSVGGVLQQTSYPTNAQFRRYIYLGQLGHTDLSTISTATSSPQPFVGLSSQFRDYEDVIGFINSGNIITANGANLKLNKSSGSLNASGINFHVDKSNPNSKSYASATAFTFRYRTQTGNGASTSDISPGFYDVGGTITALVGTKYTNQRIYLTTAGNVVIQYGQTQYNTMAEAQAGVGVESFTIYSNLVGNAALIGVLTVRSTATDLSNIAQAVFSRVSKFGETFSATSGTSGTVTSVATNNGTGITGGTITSTGTLAIDTASVISTKANVTSAASTKLNISDTATMLNPYSRKYVEVVNKTASYTLTTAENGKMVVFNSASGVNVTVPTGLGAGFNCLIFQLGAGQVTFVASGTTINNRQSFTKTKGQYAIATLVSYSTDVFVTSGDME